MIRTERRDEILRVIYTRRRESIANLAVEFGVSVRTIKYDIEALYVLASYRNSSWTLWRLCESARLVFSD